MGLAKGTRLGHYEVLELIGKGGMGLREFGISACTNCFR